MKTNRSFAGIFLFLVTLALVASASAEVTLTPVTKDKLLGRWRGGDTNDLNCILVLENDTAKLHTFRADKHLSTVKAWYRVQPREGKVTLGINGEAITLPDGKLQLKLTRQFDHLIVLREATLQRMPEPNRKELRK